MKRGGGGNASGADKRRKGNSTSSLKDLLHGEVQGESVTREVCFHCNAAEGRVGERNHVSEKVGWGD